MTKRTLKRIFIFLLLVISFAFSLIFLPNYINIGTVLAQHSEYKGPPPQSAIIDAICRKNNSKPCNEIYISKKVEIVSGSGYPKNPAKKGDTITDDEDRRLGIDGTPDKSIGVILGFKTKSEQKIKEFLAASGFSKFYSEYFYPCRAQGSFTIGWKSQKGNNGCSEIQYSPDESKITKINLKTGNKAQSKHKKFSLFPHNSRNSSTIDQQKIARSAAVHARQYCSVIENGGGQWNIQLSELTYAPSDPKKDSNYQLQTKDPGHQREAIKNVCDRALKVCEGQDKKRTCSIVNHGKWISTSQRPINLTLECAGNQRYVRRGNGQEVSKLKDEIEEEAKGAKSCIFNIYNDGDILISPDDKQRTLIHANTTNNGFAINDLVGKVKITQLGNPQKPFPVISLKPRQRYEYSLPKARKLNDKERKEVYEEPVVQEFLRCDRWDKWGDDKWKQEICNELNQYRQALNQQFYAFPAVKVTETAISGADFSGSNLIGADFSGSNFSGADFSGSNLIGVDFSGSNLSSADFSGSNLSSVDFSGSNLIGSNLSGSNFSGADFSGSNFNGSNFNGSNFNGSNLTGASVENTRFRNNTGISSEMRLDLIRRGAIFEDSSTGQ